MENNKIEFEVQNNNVEALFNPEYTPEISSLVDKIQTKDGVIPAKIIAIWEELQKEAASSYKGGDFGKNIGILAFKIASLYRLTASSNEEREFLYIAWSRYSSDYDHRKATINLFLYSVGHQLADEVIIYWADKAFQLTLDEIQYCFDANIEKDLITEAHQLTSKISQALPNKSLSYVLQLMQLPALVRDTDTSLKLNSLADHLTNQMGGVRVLESITPSGDRSVSSVCEKFEELTKIPATLVPITDLTFVKKTLDNEFPWFRPLTKKLISSLQLRALGNGDFFIPPTLILGDAGIGKTSYTLRFSQLMKVPFRTISLAGKNDNKDLAGTARAWGTGHPSMTINLINEHKVANPIVMIDEADKSGGSDHNGRILDTLLNLLEPVSSKKTYDEYLCGNCDFSHVSWICTANSVKQMPNTLLSRLDVITVEKPAFADYPAIINRSIASFFSENGIHPSHMPIIEEADWNWLEKFYTSPRVAKRAVYKWLAYRLVSPLQHEIH